MLVEGIAAHRYDDEIAAEMGPEGNGISYAVSVPPLDSQLRTDLDEHHP